MRPIDSDLQELKDLILEMGGAVELALQEARDGVVKRQPKRFAKVFEMESRINQLHLEVDERSFQVLAKQAPVARDLRLVLSLIKINKDLERMGDQANSIAFRARDVLLFEGSLPLSTLGEMADGVKEMVRDALDAFVREDLEMAQSVLKKDDEIDQFHFKLQADLTLWMRENPDCIERGLDFLGISRGLERFADHATNIAEDVIFLITGNDVRHLYGSRNKKISS